MQQSAFACVAGEGGGALELGPCLLVAAELVEEVAAHTGEKVIAPEGGLVGERVDEGECGGGTGGHGDGDGTVELDDGRWSEADELGVERGDAVPVGGFGSEGAGVAGGDRCLQGVRAGVDLGILGTNFRLVPAGFVTSRRWGSRICGRLSEEVFSVFECGEASVDEDLVPSGAVLVEEKYGLAGGADAGVET